MNLNLVIDTSQFRPFDYSLALLTMKDYGTAYQRYLDRLDKIAEENGQYVLPDTPENKQYRDAMERYKADLEAAAEDFSRGMNLRNQESLRKLFRRLHSEITPIHKAIEAYNKDVDKMTALGPDVTIANRSRNLSDYYGGLNPGIQYRSDKSIMATAAGVMQGLDNALMSAPLLAGSVANQYFELKQQGIDGPRALLEILRAHPNLNTTEGAQDVNQVMSALNEVYKQYAFEEGTPENALIWEKVKTGALQGILAPKYSLQLNHGYESPSQIAARQRQQAYLEILMARAGYIYNSQTGKYEYDENAAIESDADGKVATLSDGTTWVFDSKKKQWTSIDPSWDGVPRTSALLVDYEEKLKAKAAADAAGKDEKPGERDEETYLAMGRDFKPLNYRGLNYKSEWKPDQDDGNWINGYRYSKPWFLGGNNTQLTEDLKKNIDPRTKDDIIRRALEQNPKIKWEDLDIWVDQDAFSNNHYRVVIKGTGERGNYIDPENSSLPLKGSTTRKNTSLDSTTVVRKPNALG